MDYHFVSEHNFVSINIFGFKILLIDLPHMQDIEMTELIFYFWCFSPALFLFCAVAKRESNKYICDDTVIARAVTCILKILA